MKKSILTLSFFALFTAMSAQKNYIYNAVDAAENVSFQVENGYNLGTFYTIVYYRDTSLMAPKSDTVSFLDCDTVIFPPSVTAYLIGLQCPSGVIQPYAGSSAPTGYLLCDGSAVSRTTYSALFSIISTTYGTGDGSTTFNLPDMRQRFPLGKAASGTGNTLGSIGGNIDHVHSVDPPNTTSAAPAGSPTIGISLLGAGQAASTSHTHDVNISSFNSDSANPPYLVLNYIIKY